MSVPSLHIESTDSMIPEVSYHLNSRHIEYSMNDHVPSNTSAPPAHKTSFQQLVVPTVDTLWKWAFVQTYTDIDLPFYVNYPSYF